MTAGTMSLLMGGHQFFIHPIFVAAAWIRLYGFPWDPRLWMAFVIHDWGYWGLPNMDGPEGETHPEWAGRVMERLFGPEWGDMCRCHSRSAAAKLGKPVSKLGVADKFCWAITPAWVFLPLVRLTGEWREYVATAKAGGKFHGLNRDDSNGLADWYQSVQEYLAGWVKQHQSTKQPVQTSAQG